MTCENTITLRPDGKHVHTPCVDTVKQTNGHTKERAFVSMGERIHNEITYRGIDFLLNSAVGVGVAYVTTRTNIGKQYFGKPVTSFFRTALKPFLKSEPALAEGAKWGSMFTSIIVGGTIIITPMTMVEKKENKMAMIRWLDEKIYGREKIQSDPKFHEAYACVDNEPKQDFGTGMAARIAVLAPMIAVTVFESTNKHMVKYLYNPIANASKWLCKKIGYQPKKLMERGAMELAEGDISKAPTFMSDWDFIHRTIGFDLGLTFIYSFAHEAAYKTLASTGLFQQSPDSLETPAGRPLNVHNLISPTAQEIDDSAPDFAHSARVKPAAKIQPIELHTELAKKSESAIGMSA